MRRPSFTIEQLRSFVAVAEHGHVSRAAASLFLTQAAVTQQVRNFERALGLQLLQRAGRGVRLTAARRTAVRALIGAARDARLVHFGLARDELVLVAHRDHPLSHMRQVKPADLVHLRYLGRGPQWAAERTVRDMVGDAYDQVEVLNLGHPEY